MTEDSPGERDVDVDPFDLDDWLGTTTVTWSSVSRLEEKAALGGELVSDAGASLACDLLAVDEAYPTPVVSEAVRRAAHQAWVRGEVHLVRRDGRLTLLAPGTRLATDQVLEALRRLAKAVGAPVGNYHVTLRL